ncbi:hypothetical protein ROZALSC1DRAFT_28987 [Rozella allomycis CSF55]|uniref:Uncharacterized protein n=1 Tax=Rozella allomycis (strain CSF55) TaxID=988480 RepID=A0A075B3C2_ROZAC|nr:hypothetical protein O9G_005271 [Rozella allomycis CSF55]RKP19411.1 hypothetical protein ROZALSC1DRAFT_28987 [Rozella allomycis CSF55]|eukprot:EPZ36854.1 hypothetical protein O9G_005271 [Rozella allomycis CSF55]
MSYDPKVLKAVIKEGGKRGVEIEGAAALGGLNYFCTKVDEPNGDVELLIKSVEAMNAEVDESAEERRGGSGEIGKMILSCNEKKLALVTYVPESRKEECSAEAWLKAILDEYEGSVVKVAGTIAAGEILADGDKGRFPLKIRDEAIPKGIAYLRERGLFPVDDESDDDSVDYFGEHNVFNE